MENKTVRVTVLGTGDLMSVSVPNTAFLIESGLLDKEGNFDMGKGNKPSMLVDCGFSVFPQLFNILSEERINKISIIAITHNHMDHIGSLGQFLYYRYFKYGLDTRIYTGPLNKDSLSTILSETVTKLPSFAQSVSPRLLIRTPYIINEGGSPWYIQFFRVDHCKMPAYGIFFNDQQFTITGDTDILNPNSFALKFSNVIFHDVSLFAAPGAHTFIETITAHYPPEIVDKLMLVHHGLKDESEVPHKYRTYNFTFPNEEYFF